MEIVYSEVSNYICMQVKPFLATTIQISMGVTLVCWKEEQQDCNTPNHVIQMPGKRGCGTPFWLTSF
jgi:hypothetical protein